MTETPPTIMVIGASGLIGQAIAQALIDDGFAIVMVARQFTASQSNAYGARAVTCAIADLSPDALATLLDEHRADIVVNCLGVLQDGPHGTTADVHEGFVRRLLEAIGPDSARLLVHLSIPGSANEDMTSFSRTKREAERLIQASRTPHVILRPGFVIARAAYGGSALIRALAMLPLRLPDTLSTTPFAAVHVADIARTVALAATRWGEGERWSARWEVMSTEPSTVGDAIDAFRTHLGGPTPWVAVPALLLQAGAMAGDLVAHLGWMPPVRTTALAEMCRGVAGDPQSWIAVTGIEPLSLKRAVARTPATVQERWFARMFLLKAVSVAGLSIFWIVSGLIALFVSFDQAASVFIAHNYPPLLAKALTIVSSLMDIGIGVAIAVRRSHRAGLLAGIALSLFYMASAALLTPELWVEPLGALVKTWPAIILMLVTLAIADDR